jgi:hypothetical protein
VVVFAGMDFEALLAEEVVALVLEADVDVG